MFLPRIVFILLIIAVASDGPSTIEGSSDLSSLVDQIRRDIQPRLREAVGQPSDPRTLQTMEDTRRMVQAMRQIASFPRLDWVSSANRYRMIAFLEVMLARVEGERIAYQSGSPGVDPNHGMLLYAKAALADIATGREHIRQALQPEFQTAPELIEWMHKEDIPGHLLHLEAHAYAMLWKATGQQSDRDAARKSWAAASETSFGKKNTQPSPELANALDLYRRGEDPRLMATLLWIGVGLISLTVVIALFVPRPTSFQMFVFRIVASLGAAGVGASLPGFLGFKSATVSAGGAVGLLVLIYLVNPPRLARNLAGNEP